MPDTQTLITIGVATGGVIFFLLGLMALYSKLYRKIDQCQALIVNKMG